MKCNMWINVDDLIEKFQSYRFKALVIIVWIAIFGFLITGIYVYGNSFFLFDSLVDLRNMSIFISLLIIYLVVTYYGYQRLVKR